MGGFIDHLRRTEPFCQSVQGCASQAQLFRQLAEQEHRLSRTIPVAQKRVSKPIDIFSNILV